MMKTIDIDSDGTNNAMDSSSSSSDYFQRLSFGGTLQRMVSVYKTGFVILNKLGWTVGGSCALLWTLLLLILVPAFGIDGAYMDDPEYISANIGAFMLLFTLQWGLMLVFGVVGHASMIGATADIYLQRPTNTVRSYVAKGVQVFTPNVLASLLMFCGVTLGLILFIAPGVYVGVLWLLTHAAIVIEGMGATSGLKRSWSLVSGRWCYVFGVKLVVMLTFTILNHLWIAFVAPPIFSPLGFIVAVIPALLVSPLLSVLVTVMYLNLRVEKEGLDAQALANDIGVATNSNTEAEMTTNNNDSDSDEASEGVQVPEVV